MKIETFLPDVFLLEPKVFPDSRGFFMESYNRQTLRQLGIGCEFVQDNLSLSVPAGVIRGLHFQVPPKAQSKLVHVVTGAIYDVVLDLRKDSPTFKRWAGFILSANNRRQLFVPKGFAHGFCTLVPDTRVMYKVDEHYSSSHEGGVLWCDPELRIDWPVADPSLSEKDLRLPTLQESGAEF